MESTEHIYIVFVVVFGFNENILGTIGLCHSAQEYINVITQAFCVKILFKINPKCLAFDHQFKEKISNKK